MSETPNWFSESLSRGLLVIRAFGHDAPRLRISEVAERTGLTRAAARRFLLTLRELGYLASDGDYFHLRPRILDLGYSYISSARIEEFVEPLLKELSDKTHAAAHLAVLDDDKTLFVASIFTQKMHGFFIGVGARRPAYAGSLGKILLAGLSPSEFDNYLTRVKFVQHTQTTIFDAESIRAEVRKVREQGYSINNGEHILGVVGVGVPVRDRDAKVVAAININWFSTTPIGEAEVADYLSPLRETARQVEMKLSVGGIKPGFDTPGRG